MIIKYKEIKFIGIDGKIQHHIQRDNGNDTFTSFLANKNSTDYQAYLKWLDEGNTPTPAEE
jgi:hypothetical protein